MEKIEEKYQKLFELRIKSLELFKKAAQEIKPEQLDYYKLLDLSKLKDQYNGPEDIPLHLRRNTIYHTNNHNIREVARYLLLIHFADNLGYLGLLEIFESPDEDIQEKVWQILEKLDKDKHDYTVLLSALKDKNGFCQLGLKRLILKFFPEKLQEDQALLLDFLASDNSEFREEAWHYLRSIESNRLDLQILLTAEDRRSSYFRDRMRSFLLTYLADQLDYPVLLGFLRTMDNEISRKSRLQLDKFKADKLDYQILSDYSKTGDHGPRDGAIKLLLDHFSERLDYDELLRHLNNCGCELSDRIRTLLLDNFSNRLNVEILANCLESKDLAVVKKAWALLKNIDVAKIDPGQLFGTMNTDSIHTSDGVRFLLLKHYPDKMNVCNQLSCLASDNAEIEDMAWRYLDVIDPNDLAELTIRHMANSENRKIKKGAQILLEKIKASKKAALDVTFREAVSLFNDYCS